MRGVIEDFTISCGVFFISFQNRDGKLKVSPNLAHSHEHFVNLRVFFTQISLGMP